MTDLEDFRRYVEAQGWKPDTARVLAYHVRSFLKHVGHKPIDAITEAETREYFKDLKTATRKAHTVAVRLYIKFAARNLPVVVDRTGAALPPPARKPTKKDLALREKWTIEKLTAEKEAADDLIARLAQQVVNHYVFFEKRCKGAPDDLDEIGRFADERRELIESNLALFMGLSAGGRNINPIFRERIVR